MKLKNSYLLIASFVALLLTGSTTFAKAPAPAAPVAPAADCFHIYENLFTSVVIAPWEDPLAYEDAARAMFFQRLVEYQTHIELGHPGCTVEWVPNANAPDGMTIKVKTYPSTTQPGMVVVVFSTRLVFKVCCPDGGHGPPM